jgi:cytochrome c oxidase subunit 2
MDVVPGRYTYMWFEPTKPGRYHLFCAEYCGLNHSGMGGWIYVMEQRDFDNWLTGSVAGQTPVEEGRDLFQNKLGCASCHAGGASQRGAVLEGIFGKDVELASGDKVLVDEQYIRNSVLNPGSQIVKGYQPIMPTFKGQVTEEQLNSLVAYIKSLTPGAATTATGSMQGPAAAAASNSMPRSNADSTAQKPPAGNSANSNR